MKPEGLRFLRRKRIYAVLLLLILSLLFYKSDWLQKWLYPIRFEQDIQVSAENNKVDPFLIAAIIRVESNFRSDVQSIKGAVGVMQLMPDTASWVVDKSGYSPLTMDALYRPDVNIELGARYLQLLGQQYQGNPNVVIAAYNAGPGNVSKWLNAGTWDGSREQVDRIPFGETRHYVERVHYYYGKYSRIYADTFSKPDAK